MGAEDIGISNLRRIVGGSEDIAEKIVGKPQ